jgi:hypothetical protein
MVMDHGHAPSFFAQRNGSTHNAGLIAGTIGILVIVAIFVAIDHFPRTLIIKSLGLNDTTETPTGNQNSFANPPSALTPVDTVAYDQKILALAHIPPAPVVVTTSTKATGTVATDTGSNESTVEQFPPYPTAPGRAAIANLWPVPIKNAPYPGAGALLPFERIIAYYGNLYSTQMGVLGEYPPDQMLAMLASTTAEWAAADPSTPVVPALDYIVVTAQASPGADGKYRARMPDGQVQQIIQMASRVNGIVVLDVQVGLSNVETEVPLLEQYLKMPQVELALDPEFDMHNGQQPGTVIGTMDASDINWAARYLANLVQQNNLPPKILVVHRFTQGMVTNTGAIAPLPEVQIVMDMDGFGVPEKKIGTYYNSIEPYPVQFTGFKLFYKNDNAGVGHMMSPQEVLRLSPQPSFIQYQ